MVKCAHKKEEMVREELGVRRYSQASKKSQITFLALFPKHSSQYAAIREGVCNAWAFPEKRAPLNQQKYIFSKTKI